MSHILEKRFVSILLALILLVVSLNIIGCRKLPEKTERSLDQKDYTIREGKRLFLHFCPPVTVKMLRERAGIFLLRSISNLLILPIRLTSGRRREA